jgi:MFS family permease
MPLYIRDYVDTSDLVQLLLPFGDGVVSFLAFVNEPALANKIGELFKQQANTSVIAAELLHLKVRVPEEVIAAAISQFGQTPSVEQAAQLASSWANNYRQINPEYIINLDFAAIIFCQIGVSYLCQRFKSINVLVSGTVIFAIACALAFFANSIAMGGSFIVIVVLMMAFGEMVTSPKSQEFVASIAPKHQSALYMGYYFVSMALGFLVAGFLSGWGYGELAKNMNRPDLMWSLFAAIGLLTAIGLMWFNRKYVASARFSATEQASTQTV